MIDIQYFVIVFIVIIFSMTLHEAAHAYASNILGDDTARLSGRLTLNPIAHIDPITTLLMPLVMMLAGLPPFGAAKPVPFNPNRLRYGEYGAAIVGMAGPVVNITLAFFAGLFLQTLGLLGYFVPNIVVEVVGMFVLVNLAFFLFNMIPFPPLDGSRLVYVFAPDSVRSVMQRIEFMGPVAFVMFYMLFIFILSGPFVRVLGYMYDATMQWLLLV